ncbi:transporter [Variovorax paradoxus]|uniref:SphA family protein n=1 Tax=Variovorax paradoxus TaxID=34073 RepID=UPI001934317E|nr:transporter [Variovorax paradoxus]
MGAFETASGKHVGPDSAGHSTSTQTSSNARAPGRRWLSVAVFLLASPAFATEGGGNSYPMGVETNFNGVMLPEGAHWFVYYSHYGATHSKNHAGEDNPQLARFRLAVNTVAPRLSYVWPGARLFGAKIETRVVQAIVASDLEAAVARPDAQVPLNRGGNRTGLADMALSPVILGWHSETFHQTTGIDLHLKTGTYDVSERVNTGRNYAQAAVFYAFTWFPATGFDLNAKLRYAANQRNKATDYRSGNEASIEFSGGYRVNPQLVVGFNGYVYRQTTDDEQAGRVASGNGNRGRVNSFGPYLTYNLTPRLALVAKLQQEFGARNKPEGMRLWLQARMPL